MNVFVLFRNIACIAKLLDISLILDGTNLDSLRGRLKRPKRDMDMEHSARPDAPVGPHLTDGI